MLYHLYDFQSMWLAPMRLAAETVQHTFSHPMVPVAYTGFGRAIAASSEMIERSTRRYGKPRFGIASTTIAGAAVSVRVTVKARTTFCDLVHCERNVERDDPKVLIVAPLSGHYATLLRGTVEAMLPEHDVYVTDWINASSVPVSKGRFDLDDYIDLLIRFCERLGPDLNIVAVCQPSVPVLAAVALMADSGHPATPRTMTLMGGPIDTRMNPTKVNKFAETRSREWFERTVITTVPATYPGFMRRVYPGFLQLSGFMGMNLDRHFASAMRHFQHLIEGDGDSAASHRAFYDEYLSVMDLPAEFYLQTIDAAFREHALPLGAMRWRGRPVRPGAIRDTALMTIEGELDDISGPGQTYAAHGLCTGVPARLHRHYLAKGVGHFGIFNGRRWRTEIQPRVRDFIRAPSVG